MSKQQAKKNDIVNGRISLLFFALLLFGGLLWLVRTARYRYDLIFRPMLIWLLPTLFGVTFAVFAVLLVLWLHKGRPQSEKLFDLPFFLLLTAPLPAAFLFPWLTLFANGLQFYSLATELVFYAAIGGYIGYIAYAKLGKIAILPAVGSTLNLLALTYFYLRHLAPSSLFLNTEEYNYMDGWAVALLLIALVAVAHLLPLLLMRKTSSALPAWSFLLPAVLTALLLGVHGFIELPLLAVRISIFVSMGLIAVWYVVWCVLKRYKKL